MGCNPVNEKCGAGDQVKYTRAAFNAQNVSELEPKNTCIFGLNAALVNQAMFLSPTSHPYVHPLYPILTLVSSSETEHITVITQWLANML